MTTEIQAPDQGKIQDTEKRGQELITRAQQMAVIKSADDYSTAAEFVKACKKAEKEAADVLGPHKKKTYEAYKSASDLYNRAIKRYEDARKIVSGKMQEWDAAERARLAKEQAAMQAKAQKNEEKNREKLAKAAEKSGDTEKAAELREAPVTAPKVEVTPTHKQSGISYRDNWQYEVTDVRKLAAAVAEGKVLPDVLQVNAGAMRKAVNFYKDKLDWPGVKVWNQPVQNIRT